MCPRWAVAASTCCRCCPPPIRHSDRMTFRESAVIIAGCTIFTCTLLVIAVHLGLIWTAWFALTLQSFVCLWVGGEV